MITPMTRYEFLLYHTDVEAFLERVRELGLVDITLGDVALSDQQKELLDQSERYKKVGKAMASVKVCQPSEGLRLEQVVNGWEEAQARINALGGIILKAEEEVKELEKWGEFDVKLIEDLRSRGLELRFFEVANKGWRDQWEEMYPLEVVAKTEHSTFFVVVVSGDDKYIDLPAIEMRMPTMSSVQKSKQVELLIQEQKDEQDKLCKLASYREAVLSEGAKFEERLDFSRVMGAGENLVENKVRLMEGWCEKQNREQIEAFAKQEEVVYSVEEGKIEHNPPIKLKNNWFSSLYEPIGNLYMLPRYNELDLTPFFAPFFMIFFGMCLGDAGYGLLIIAAAALMWKKIPKTFKSIAWLVIFLNISAMFFGLISGNFFGIELVKIDAFSDVKKYMVLSDPNTVFYFSIMLGGVQVLFGQILRIFNRIKRGGRFIYGVSSIGWVVLWVSAIVAFFTEQTSEIWFYGAVGLAGVMIVLFANPDSNIFLSAGKGVYSIYEMATGVVGDLISYVRLFAIGLAGAIIAQVFNELALGLSGDVIIIKQLAMVVILTFGHGLNIFISILGAFVHPVRLTFVEFYKNAEFEGGSRRFNPLRRKA